jgi:exodeoxyribonuclease V beta subunit
VPVHGLLIGSIDLVLRDDGRFWIADYKSNGLGQWVETVDGERRWVETEAHTTPDRVMAAMVTGDYLLQAHLYTVALHRYLRARLGEAYDYDTHVGGWTYLFLRGMTGDDVARTDGLPHGIATGRPRRELVEDLDALLRGQGVAP